MMNNIDDLPDLLLVEMLCRLPCESAVQCKCVSKRWLALISDPYFVGHFLRLQHDKKKPMILSLVLLTQTKHKIEVYTTSNHPALMKASNLSLSFLPYFEAMPDVTPVVLGMYNDLVLCCATYNYERDYYICNPCTKQWVALPPTPRVHKEVSVGFICDLPYYYNYFSKESKQRQTSGGSSSSFKFFNGKEYRWKVVRIVPNSSSTSDIPPGFHVEMFSSESREWRDLVVLCPQPFPFDSSPSFCSGVAYNGMLYWFHGSGITLELDPFNTNGDTIAQCRFIGAPQDYKFLLIARLHRLGVSRGCLRMYPWLNFEPNLPISVWELKEDDGKLNKWCLSGDKLSSDQMVSKDPLIEIKKGFLVLGFHPNNKDIMYLELCDKKGMIIMCNLHERRLEIATKIPTDHVDHFDDWLWRGFYTFVLPWWPTPVPTLV